MSSSETQTTSEPPPKNSRFRDRDEETVIDLPKRLLWLKKDTWQMTGKWMSWVQVRDYAEQLCREKFAGFSNWRLPTPAEAKSLMDRTQKNKDHTGAPLPLPLNFAPGSGFLCWTSEVRNKVQAVRFGYRKGFITYDDIYRTSRGATRLVRDIEKGDGISLT